MKNYDRSFSKFKTRIHHPYQNFLKQHYFFARNWGLYLNNVENFLIEDFEIAILERLKLLFPYEIIKKKISVRLFK